jgi:hypothetical protein
MSKPEPPKPIDLAQLQAVTGGRSHGVSDPLLNDLSSLASQIKNVSQQTSGFSSSQMFLLCALVLQRNNNNYGNTNFVYVSRGPRWW